MPVKIEFNKDGCIGCGACAATCEASFEMEGDKAKVKTPELEEVGCAQDAADGCPVDCITVTEM